MYHPGLIYPASSWTMGNKQLLKDPPLHFCGPYPVGQFQARLGMIYL